MSVTNQSRVKDVMTAPLETISRNATVSEAATKMREEGIRSLVVTTSPPAIVTSTDVLEAASEGSDTTSTPVTEIATESVETVPPTLRVDEVAAMMTSLGINHLPVKDGSDYVGMISSTDIAATMS